MANDPRRCEALLRDLCGEHRREINLLISAARERIAFDLLTRHDTVPLGLLSGQLIDRLEEHLGLTNEAAEWAVHSWGLALDLDLLAMIPQKPHSASRHFAPSVARTPYVFPSTGGKAHTLEAFTDLCLKQRAIAIEHLYRGYFEPWFRHELRRVDLADLAQYVRTTYTSPSTGYLTFLESISNGSQDVGHRQTITSDNILNIRPLIKIKGHENTIRHLSFSPDGLILATSSRDGTISLWWTHDGMRIRTLQGPHLGFEGVAFSPDGSLLASITLDHTIVVWNIYDGRIVKTIFVGKGCYHKAWDLHIKLSFSPDGKTIVFGCSRIEFWDYDSETIKTNCRDDAYNTTLLSDRTALTYSRSFTGDFDVSSIEIRDIISTDLVKEFSIQYLLNSVPTIPDGMQYDLIMSYAIISPNRRFISMPIMLLNIDKRYVITWQYSNGLHLATISTNRPDPIRDMVFLLDSTGVVLCGGTMLSYYRIDDGNIIDLDWRNSDFSLLALSDDQRFLAVSSEDHSVEIWGVP